MTLRRTWKDGDRIEVEFDMPLRTEAVDAQHADIVALLHGPVALFALREMGAPDALRRADLLGAQPIGMGSEWRAKASSGELRLKPFPEIRTERYRLYQQVIA